MTGRTIHPLASAESWELDEDLRHIGRLASAWRAAAPTAASDDSGLAPMGATPSAMPAIAADRPADESASANAGLPPWSATAATCMGLTALTCGLVLACWSLYADRPGLMPLALPGAVAGLVGMALGQLGARRSRSRRDFGRVAAVA